MTEPRSRERRAPAGFTIGYDSQPLLFGANIENGQPNYFWNGSLDDGYYFNRALSATEVQHIDYSKNLGVAVVPPTISATQSDLVVNEGQTATNSGVLNDPDGENAGVLLTSNVGTVIQDPNNPGQWTWSLDTTSINQSQTVVITANDGHGGITTTSFELKVLHNNAPTALVRGATRTNEGSLYTLNLYAFNLNIDSDTRPSRSTLIIGPSIGVTAIFRPFRATREH